MTSEATVPSRATDPARIVRRLGGRSIVLVGMMGAGKSSVGRRLAARLDLPFSDADTEIEQAANQTIPEIFATHGEAYFRDGERRVIGRLLREGPRVIATGGGAFMSAETRTAIAELGVSVWLDAEFHVLRDRLKRKSNRPLLAGVDLDERLKTLIAERYPIYALADVRVKSSDVPQDSVVEAVMAALDAHFSPSEDA